MESKEQIEETVIAKLRNKLSPIYNHFQMRTDLATKILIGSGELSELRLVMYDNEAVCKQILPEISDLLYEAAQQTSTLQAENVRLREFLKSIELITWALDKSVERDLIRNAASEALKGSQTH